jgi:hypothetical protein
MEQERKKFIDILREAYKEKCSLEIPFKVENGNLVDEDFFHSVFGGLGEDDTIKVINITDTEIIFEIQYQGIGNILKDYENNQKELKAL